MDVKGLLTVFLSCLIGTCGGGNDTITGLNAIGPQAGFERPDIPVRETVSGDFLASQFAQQHHDWKTAGRYLDDILKKTPDDIQVLKRAMVLAMGAGDFEKSLGLARKVEAVEKENSLALMFLAASALHDKDYKLAHDYVGRIPAGSLSDFIMPLLKSWTEAGIGVYDAKDLNKNIIHVHHAILIADFLGKTGEIENLLKKAEETPELTPVDREKIADIYAHIGHKNKAMDLYQKVLKDFPGEPALTAKIETLGKEEKLKAFETVSGPAQGIALALNNMGQLLYQEYADESARVFANIALYLDPSMMDSNLLLAAIATRNSRSDDAIGYYLAVPKESEYYLEARRRAAELMEDSNRTDEALAELKGLFKTRGDVESLIRIGDIYRRKEDFQNALTSYNEAANHFGTAVPKEYWHLLYARGMSYERLGEWQNAENDLKAALAYQPEHPYVLNYLGYAWTDKGVNLEQALGMIKKAAELRPTDGYIADSLGWVYYRMGRYESAVPHLESAVEMVPYDPVINDHLGDAYWQAGRKLEARFQWQRARNYSEDTQLIAAIDKKLSGGLEGAETLKQAHSAQAQADDTIQR